jgi:hypothetical protein
MAGRMGFLLGSSLVVALVGGCALGSTPPSTAAPASPTSAPPAIPSGPPPTPVPSAPRGGDGTIDPATFLQLCGGWPGDAADDPVQCDRLVQTALRGLPAGDPVTRVETSYSCLTACRPIDPNRGYVIVVTSAGAVEVEVGQQADGSYSVVAMAPMEVADTPAFTAPPVAAPAVDGAPPAVNARAPLPHCGLETRDMGGPFDSEGRQCFWDGIRAGSPVEFVETHPDTEGLQVTTVYRFDGSGAVEVVTNDEGGYWLIHTGIGPAAEPGRVFEMAGLGDRQPYPAG